MTNVVLTANALDLYDAMLSGQKRVAKAPTLNERSEVKARASGYLKPNCWSGPGEKRRAVAMPAFRPVGCQRGLGRSRQPADRLWLTKLDAVACLLQCHWFSTERNKFCNDKEKNERSRARCTFCEHTQEREGHLITEGKTRAYAVNETASMSAHILQVQHKPSKNQKQEEKRRLQPVMTHIRVKGTKALEVSMS